MARRRTRRRQRGGRSSRKRRRRKRGGDDMTDGTCSTTSTAPSAEACNSPAAQKDKRSCNSRGWNPVKGKAECVWTPKSQVQENPQETEIETVTERQSNPAAKSRLRGMFKRVRNIEGKKKSEAALAKYGLNKDGNAVVPGIEEPIVETLPQDSSCEDDDTFIRQGEGASGKPLCEVIRSRKAKIAAETDQDKKREMIQVVMKNCSKLGAQHCKKTCGKCPKKEVVSEQPPPPSEIEPEPEPEPEPIKPTGTCKGRKAKFDKKCVGVDDKTRCNNKKSCNWEEPTGGRSRRRRRRKRRKTRKGKRTKRRRRKRKRKRTRKR